MRLDKYLKVSRLIKRRTLAQEMCNGGRVTKNGRTAKPSTDVDIGDVIEVSFGPRKISIEVLALAENASKKTAGSLYRQLSGENADVCINEG